jgi:hypothetical protein
VQIPRLIVRGSQYALRLGIGNEWDHYAHKPDEPLKKSHEYSDPITNLVVYAKSIMQFTVLLDGAIPGHDQLRLTDTLFTDGNLDCSGQEMKKTELPKGEKKGALVQNMKPTQIGKAVWQVCATNPDNEPHTYTVRMYRA